jgi:hypothetical protein
MRRLPGHGIVVGGEGTEETHMLRIRTLIVPTLVLGTLITSWPGQTSAAVPVSIGPNVNITQLAGNQAEGTIAVNPTNPQELFFASNPGAIARRSTDGGTTWVAAGAGIGTSCCDNVAAWDSFDNLFLVNLDLTAPRAINLYLSTDGGANFTLLATLDTGPNQDQPAVKAGAGSVWVTWNDGTGIQASGASVTGQGAANIGAFSAKQAAPGTPGQFGDIAIGPLGQVVVTYQESNSPCPCRIFANTDADGLGAGGFGAQVTVTSMNVNTFDFIAPQSGRSVDSEANLAWDRSTGRLYLVYTNEFPDESDDTDIFVRFSDDNGATWSAAVQVNDDVTTTSQFIPNISLDQTTGNVAVSWHDARNDATNNNAQFFGAVSDDGGASFGTNLQISAGTSNDDVAGSSVDYGDYCWSDFDSDRLHVVWADNSNSTGDNPAGANSTFDMYTARILLKFRPSIDIKFCSHPNAFNSRRTRGVVPVTIFGGEEGLDVGDIDISTLQLCVDGVGCTGPPVDWSFADRGDPASDLGASMCAIVDEEEQDFLNPDGFVDLDVAFSSAEVCGVIGCGGLGKGDTSDELMISGFTTDGVPIMSGNTDILDITR